MRENEREREVSLLRRKQTKSRKGFVVAEVCFILDHKLVEYDVYP